MIQTTNSPQAYPESGSGTVSRKMLFPLMCRHRVTGVSYSPAWSRRFKSGFPETTQLVKRLETEQHFFHVSEVSELGKRINQRMVREMQASPAVTPEVTGLPSVAKTNQTDIAKETLTTKLDDSFKPPRY